MKVRFKGQDYVFENLTVHEAIMGLEIQKTYSNEIESAVQIVLMLCRNRGYNITNEQMYEGNFADTANFINKVATWIAEVMMKATGIKK